MKAEKVRVIDETKGLKEAIDESKNLILITLHEKYGVMVCGTGALYHLAGELTDKLLADLGEYLKPKLDDALEDFCKINSN
jgi:hypothetical protein